ncbi:Uncharacterized protein APZ42_020256, partial [Daphnia magna]
SLLAACTFEGLRSPGPSHEYAWTNRNKATPAEVLPELERCGGGGRQVLNVKAGESTTDSEVRIDECMFAKGFYIKGGYGGYCSNPFYRITVPACQNVPIRSRNNYCGQTPSEREQRRLDQDMANAINKYKGEEALYISLEFGYPLDDEKRVCNWPGWREGISACAAYAKAFAEDQLRVYETVKTESWPGWQYEFMNPERKVMSIFRQEQLGCWKGKGSNSNQDWTDLRIQSIECMLEKGYVLNLSHIGSSSQRSQAWLDATSQSQGMSLMGSTEGDVRIVAGKTYTQQGSDVLTPQGDIAILAKSVNIEDGRDKLHVQTKQEFKQSGLTVALGGGILDTLTATGEAIEGVTGGGSNRNKTLNALIAYGKANDLIVQGKAVNNAAKQNGVLNSEGKTDAAAASGIKVSIGVGASSSKSQSDEQYTKGTGSTIKAAGNVTVIATEGDLNVKGSRVQAKNDLALVAANNVNIVASTDTQTHRSSNESSSASVGDRSIVIVIDSHSRGTLTTDNALQSINNQGGITDGNGNTIKPSIQLNNYGGAQNNESGSKTLQQVTGNENAQINSVVHPKDLVGKTPVLVGGNPTNQTYNNTATGSEPTKAQDDGKGFFSNLWNILFGKATPHNCYGTS